MDTTEEGYKIPKGTLDFEQSTTTYKAIGIYSAMISVMKDISHVSKDQTNKKQGFKYRGIDDIYNALHISMAKHGVFCTSDLISQDVKERQAASGNTILHRIMVIRYTFHAEDGSTVQTVVPCEGFDSGDKASNKCLAAAHKYALLQCFVIPTAEQQDPDKDSYEIVKFTTDQYDEYMKHVLSKNDAIGFYVFLSDIGHETETALYNSGEKGEKMKHKQAHSELKEKGWCIYNEYMSSLRICIDEKDFDAINELKQEMGKTVFSQIFPQMNPEHQAFLKEMNNG